MDTEKKLALFEKDIKKNPDQDSQIIFSKLISFALSQTDQQLAAAQALSCVRRQCPRETFEKVETGLICNTDSIDFMQSVLMSSGLRT
jgi:hypothetical protein